MGRIRMLRRFQSDAWHWYRWAESRLTSCGKEVAVESFPGKITVGGWPQDITCDDCAAQYAADQFKYDLADFDPLDNPKERA